MTEDIQVDVPIPHYVMLPPHTDDPGEPIRYDCSLCDLDVYNISMHSQFEHGVRNFTVDNEEHEREQPVVGHLCGVSGCTFDGNHDGAHSWEASEPVPPIAGDIPALRNYAGHVVAAPVVEEEVVDGDSSSSD